MNTMNTRKRYRGSLRAAILDWAGTSVDHGSLAPVRVLVDLFRSRGLKITDEEARLDMGLLKKDHIRSILKIGRVKCMWIDRFGRLPSESDVEEIFEEFVPRQLQCLAEYSRLIPGVTEGVETMRSRGMLIGSTTGYTRPMLDLLLECAAAQGYTPDSAVCPDDVGAGRPFPWMCYRNAIQLNVYPMEALVKIGDTACDVEEGLNAGMWTIGVVRTGNEIGLCERDFFALSASQQSWLLEGGRERLRRAGAHYVIDGIDEVRPALDAIDERLARGEKP
jgi:phosphonoacetaldehyde hydrolase